MSLEKCNAFWHMSKHMPFGVSSQVMSNPLGNEVLTTLRAISSFALESRQMRHLELTPLH